LLMSRKWIGARMRALVWWVTLLQVTVFSAAVLAAEGQFYLGAGGGSSTIKPATRSVDIQTGFSVEDDSDGLIKLFAGYDLTDYWSVEGFVASYGTAKLVGPARFSDSGNASGLGNNFLNDGGTVFGTVDYKLVGAQTLLQFPHNKPGLSAILKLGVSQILTNSSSNLPFTQADQTKFTTGFGLEYQLANHVAVRAEYIYHSEKVQGVSISALKRFGRRKVKTVPEPKVPPVVAKPAARVPAQRAKPSQRGNASSSRPRPTSRQPSQQARIPIKAPPPPPPAPARPRPPQGLSVAPSQDGDGDGVIDPLDRCPSTPAGVVVSSNGCAAPAEVAEASAAEMVSSVGPPRVLEGVTFESGSARLTLSAKQVLDEVARELLARPNVRVTVVGHTDNVGSARKNKLLSEKRAQAVARYLAHRGVPVSRLRYGGKGEEMPVASNATPEGRAANRRVELIEEQVGF